MSRQVKEIHTNGTACETAFFINNRGGYGVVCPFDRSLDCRGFYTEGIQSDKRYELEAVKKALMIAMDIEGPCHVKIHTGTWFPIGALTIWLDKWRLNGWKTDVGNSVKNRHLIENIDDIMKNMSQYDKTVQLVHSRESLSNSFSQEAERLAKLATEENNVVELDSQSFLDTLNSYLRK